MLETRACLKNIVSFFKGLQWLATKLASHFLHPFCGPTLRGNSAGEYNSKKFFKIPLFEDYGRKPLIIVGLLGYIVLNIAFFINSWFMYELKAEYLLFECLQDLFGGDIVFSLGIYSLLVDKTEPEARTRRMSILQVSPFCSISSRFICSLILLFLRLSCLWG